MAVIPVGSLPGPEDPDYDFTVWVDGQPFTCIHNAPSEPDVWQGIENHPGDVVPLYSGPAARSFVKQVLDLWTLQAAQKRAAFRPEPQLVSSGINGPDSSTP